MDAEESWRGPLGPPSWRRRTGEGATLRQSWVIHGAIGVAELVESVAAFGLAQTGAFDPHRDAAVA